MRRLVKLHRVAVTTVLLSMSMSPSFVSAASGKRVWKVSGVELTLSSKDFSANRGGRQIFSARKHVNALLTKFNDELRTALAQSETAPAATASTPSANYVLDPISVVGTIVSLRESGNSLSLGAARAAQWDRVAARNWGTPTPKAEELPGRAASLLDVWSERQVVDALAADSYVRELLPKDSPPSTLAALWDAMARAKQADGDVACKYEVHFDDGLLRAFAFHHIDGDKVAVRIWIEPGSEVCQGQSKQLGLLLPIPSQLRDALDKADRRESGFLMKDFKTIGSPSYSVSSGA